jgi:hypothetical protein
MEEWLRKTKGLATSVVLQALFSVRRLETTFD